MVRLDNVLVVVVVLQVVGRLRLGQWNVRFQRQLLDGRLERRRFRTRRGRRDEQRRRGEARIGRRGVDDELAG